MKDDLRYLDELRACKLCEWNCDVNRIEGEKGVCGITIPQVASSFLHPAPPASYDAFMVGCSFRCISCQNWRIANYPKNTKNFEIEGYYPPKRWGEIAVLNLKSSSAQMIGADRLFFTGGEPTCSLPWIEEVLREAKKIDPKIKVNYDTNGFLTEKSLKRVLEFATSITFDIKAYNEETFRQLTGAPAEPVLRNAEYIGKNAKDKLWEFRILVIPKILIKEVPDMCEFISEIDPSLPVCFLAFRPNFVMETHQGATRKLMESCVEIARKSGLENVSWAGYTDIGGKISESTGSKLASEYAIENGCIRKIRDCGGCESRDECKIKSYVPYRST